MSFFSQTGGPGPFERDSAPASGRERVDRPVFHLLGDSSAPVKRYRIRDVLKFIAVLYVVLALLAWSGVDLAFFADWPISIICPLGVVLLCALSIMRPRARSPRCESCGRRFFRARKGEPIGLCPTCRVAKVSPEQHRRLATQGFAIIFILLLMLSFVLAYPFAGFMQPRLGALAYPTIAIGVFVILFVVCAGALVLRLLVRMRRMNNPRNALKVARSSAGDVGEETTFGPVSVHVFGASDPTMMLKCQWEICRRRFESLIGEPLEVDRPLRCFVFGKRNSFDAIFKWAFLYVGNLDGMYVPWSRATISITTDFPDHRLPDLERTTRVLFTYYYLESHRKSPSPLWVQTGISHVVASGGDEMESARLNRKMLAALSRGDSLGTADLFHISPRSMVKLLRDWRDFDNFSRLGQLITQSCSVVEFLCSRPERLERFRAFLKEPTKKSRIEEAFQRHFDHGFEVLLEQWRLWVRDRGIGSHRPPPDHIRDALMERVIPIVEDKGANTLERIQAIREMGKAGYVLGADALIDLLSEDDQIPAKEVVRSLELISGLALGNDVEKWTDWFDHLPRDATDV